MSVNRHLIPILAITLLLGTVGVAMLTGNWIVSGKELINVEQMTSSADIRGWMTIDQVATGLNIDLPVLYDLVGIPAEIPADTALKDMEQIVPDFETSAVRDAVAVYLGEATVEDSAAVDTAVDAAATPALTPSPTPVATQPPVTTALPATPTAVHVPQSDGIGDGIGTGDGTGPTPLPPGTRLTADEIKGRHTLQEIADQAQVPLDALIAALGLPPDADPAQSVRDLVESGRIAEVDDVRVAVTALQN